MRPKIALGKNQKTAFKNGKTNKKANSPNKNLLELIFHPAKQEGKKAGKTVSKVRDEVQEKIINNQILIKKTPKILLKISENEMMLKNVSIQVVLFGSGRGRGVQV